MSSVFDQSPRPDLDDAGDPTRAATLPEDPSGSAALVGQRIVGRYVLEGLVGVGAVGRVFRARRENDGAIVALKLLHERHRGDRLVQKRLAREVEATRPIDHPNVVRVLEHGDDDGRPFVCMELIEGNNLRALLREQMPTPRRIGALLGDVLSVLQEAHRHGVIHRDLKPDNVLVTRDHAGREVAKVCDFGVAKLVKPEPGTAITLDGMVCGTAEYMAPEQGAGKDIDGRADVYAVGVIFYELLAGTVPFREASPLATISKHMLEPVIAPSIRSPQRAMPPELERVCMKALAKDPNQRFQSAREMAQALRLSVDELGVRADEPLGSSAFAHVGGNLAASAADRLTMPGEQLRSHTKVWLGAGLLLLVCAALWFAPAPERDPNPPASPPPSVGPEPFAMPRAPDGNKNTAPLGLGQRSLAEGKLRLRQNDVAGALSELQRAQIELGDTPELLRALGEALVRAGKQREGGALLTRYLTLEPGARDRAVVERLLETDR